MKFCTYITIYSGNILPPFYIGSTSVDRISTGYHGTVKSKKYKSIWISEIQNNPHLFRTTIVSTHPSREDALIKERHIQISLGIPHNSLYINQSVAGGKFILGKGNTGKNVSPETKIKISRGRIGKGVGWNKKPDAYVRAANISRALMGHSVSNETRTKLSKINKGKNMSSEAKAKIKEFQKGRKKDPASHKKMWETRRMNIVSKENGIG